MSVACPHKPERQYSGIADGILWVGCCDCGRVVERNWPPSRNRPSGADPKAQATRSHRPGEVARNRPPGAVNVKLADPHGPEMGQED